MELSIIQGTGLPSPQKGVNFFNVVKNLIRKIYILCTSINYMAALESGLLVSLLDREGLIFLFSSKT